MVWGVASGQLRRLVTLMTREEVPEQLEAQRVVMLKFSSWRYVVEI